MYHKRYELYLIFKYIYHFIMTFSFAYNLHKLGCLQFRAIFAPGVPRPSFYDLWSSLSLLTSLSHIFQENSRKYKFTCTTNMGPMGGQRCLSLGQLIYTSLLWLDRREKASFTKITLSNKTRVHIRDYSAENWPQIRRSSGLNITSSSYINTVFETRYQNPNLSTSSVKHA